MRERLRSVLRLTLAVAVCALIFSQGALAGPKVVLIIANRLTLSDIIAKAPPNIARLVSNGAVGLVCANSPGAKSVEAVYLSMGAGSGLLGQEEALQGYDASEIVEGSPAAIVYARRAGLRPPKAGSVVNIALPQIISHNARKGFLAKPGLMGEALRRGGKRVAVFGNSDLPDMVRRPAVNVAMDARGVIPTGAVGPGILKRDQASPTGVISDVQLMLRLALQAAKRADLLVIDFGDTDRLEEVKEDLSEAACAAHLRSAIARLDRLVGGLLDAPETAGSVFVFISPLPRTENESLDRLAPIVVYSAEPAQAGSLLTSPTTRTEGLVAVTDIAPTVLSILGVGPADGVLGRPIAFAQTANRLEKLLRLDSVVALQARAEFPVLGALAAALGVVVTLLSLILSFQLSVAPRVIRALRFMAAMAFCAPLAMLIGAFYNGQNMMAYVIALAVCMAASTLVLTYPAWLLDKRSDRSLQPISSLPALIALATTLALLADTLTGARLVKFSLMSLYQLHGLRFYGIGNEYMGVLIGTTAVAALWVRQRLPLGPLSVRARALFALGLGLTALVIGLPDLGANAGGFVAAIITFGLCYRAITKNRITARDVLCLLVLSGLAVGVVAALDLWLRAGLSSHIGQAAGMVEEDGWRRLWATIMRKVGFNIQLLGTRQGETALIGFAPFFALWYFGVQRRVSARLKSRPDLAAGFAAVAVGAGAAFLFNDSGVVAAAFILGASVVTLLYSLADSWVQHE